MKASTGTIILNNSGVVEIRIIRAIDKGIIKCPIRSTQINRVDTQTSPKTEHLTINKVTAIQEIIMTIKHTHDKTIINLEGIVISEEGINHLIIISILPDKISLSNPSRTTIILKKVSIKNPRIEVIINLGFNQGTINGIIETLHSRI